MNEASETYKLPIEWVDRIFTRLEQIFGDKFKMQFKDTYHLELERLRWQSGLYGVTADEIRKTLQLCMARMTDGVPNVIEFFSYCKNYKPPQKARPVKPPQSEIAKQYLALLKDKLNGKAPPGSERDIALSTLDQQVLDNENRKKKPNYWDK